MRVNRVESYFEVGSTKGRKVPIVGFTTVVDIPHSTSVEVTISILYIISIL
jgi:hypothetical protein